jgi:hypothetical protein
LLLGKLAVETEVSSLASAAIDRVGAARARLSAKAGAAKKRLSIGMFGVLSIRHS